MVYKGIPTQQKLWACEAKLPQKQMSRREISRSNVSTFIVISCTVAMNEKSLCRPSTVSQRAGHLTYRKCISNPTSLATQILSKLVFWSHGNRALYTLWTVGSKNHYKRSRLVDRRFKNRQIHKFENSFRPFEASKHIRDDSKLAVKLSKGIKLSRNK